MLTVRTSSTNARAILKWDRGYEEISREERNVAALFYHLILEPQNLRRFIALAESRLPIVEEQVAVFFEYAYLRDLWSTRVGTDAAVARDLILELLAPPNSEELRRMSAEDFNRYFGVSGFPSRDFVQSPGRWSIRKFAGNIPDNDFFLRVCRFKWAFNAKPDVVIHTSYDSALCIEAKFESGEGHYPSSDVEKAEFSRRGIPLQTQTDLQSYILKDLLGLQTEFVFLVANNAVRSPTHRTITWGEAFAALDHSAAPPFVHKWLKRFAL